MKYLSDEKKITAILRQWKYESGVTTTVKFGYRAKCLTICTSQCGFMIGRKGEIVDKYRQMLKDYNVDVERIDFLEVNCNNI